jgi:hypothetical protein
MPQHNVLDGQRCSNNIRDAISSGNTSISSGTRKLSRDKSYKIADNAGLRVACRVPGCQPLGHRDVFTVFLLLLDLVISKPVKPQI